MTEHFAFMVDRRDISQAALRPVSPPDLQPGEARLDIERLALSANTLTYGVTGDAFGYWKFFPVSGPAGLIPTWGIARVAQSRSDTLPEGSRWFGFLPLASCLVVAPTLRGEGLFTDTAPHRQLLPANYNIYRNVERDPHFLSGREEECALLRPLVMLSFLLAEHLKSIGLEKGDQVAFTSASSKAALAAAFLAKRAGLGPCLGLTSAMNAAFVRATGAYDAVATYDEIEELEAAPRVLLDISGHDAARARMEARWGASLIESQIVGATHWGASVESLKSTSRTRFFFAPDVMKRLIGSWGAEAFEAQFLDAWHAVLDWTPGWLTLEQREGAAGLADAYAQLLQGAVPPDRGLVVAIG